MLFVPTGMGKPTDKLWKDHPELLYSNGGEKYKAKEEKFQEAAAQLLQLKGVWWFHPPNEIKAPVHYLAKRRRLGVKNGVSDVVILSSFADKKGLIVELKAGYNKPSDEQIRFLLEARDNGFAAYWTYSLDDLIDLVNSCYG